VQLYLSKTRATNFLMSRGGSAGVQTEQGEIHAPVVIAAAGPWTRPLFQSTGFDPPIETEFHQVAILRTRRR